MIHIILCSVLQRISMEFKLITRSFMAIHMQVVVVCAVFMLAIQCVHLQTRRNTRLWDMQSSYRYSMCTYYLLFFLLHSVFFLLLLFQGCIEPVTILFFFIFFVSAWWMLYNLMDCYFYGNTLNSYNIVYHVTTYGTVQVHKKRC